MKINYKIFSYGIVAIFIVFVAVLMASHFNVKKVRASIADNLSGWAWSETIGWIHFNDTSYGVNVAANGAITGYAWSENIGWINFAGANFNKATGKVTGTISAIAGAGRIDGWDGTIKLSGTASDSSSYGVSVSGCDWNGYAWGSDVVGWIHFKGAEYGVIGTGDACMSAPECSDNIDNVDPEDSLIDEFDPGCHSDGNPNNPGSYDPNDNDETNLLTCSIGQTNPHSTCVGNACVLMASCGATSCSSNADCTPPPVFDFSLSNNGPKSVIQGQSVQNLITADLLSPPTQPVNFSVSGLPPGATFSFSINSCNPNCSTTLTINTTLATPPGDYIIIVSGVSTALTRTTQFVLTVNQARTCDDGIDNDCDGFCDQSGCTPPAGFCNAGIPLLPDPSCAQSVNNTEYSACNDLNSYPGGTPKDNDGDVDTNIDDKGCHSDGNQNNPASYDPNDNDESNTIFREVFVPFENLLAMLFMRF